MYVIKIQAEPLSIHALSTVEFRENFHPSLHPRFGDPERSKLRVQIGSKNDLIVNLDKIASKAYFQINSLAGHRKVAKNEPESKIR